MNAPVRALLAGIVDYAGLFPPAKLPFDPAIRNYAQYRKCADAWMLGRFICPAARLAELDPYVRELLRGDDCFPLSMLGTGGATVPEVLEKWQGDLAAAAALHERHRYAARVEVLEVKAPVEALQRGEAAVVEALLQEALRRRDAFAETIPTLDVYLEVPWDSEYREVFAVATAAIAEFRRTQPQHRIGFKLRTGGLEAVAFPSVPVIAAAIDRCRRAAVPMKCTAGLHHPVRAHHDSVQTKMHGFLNVFGAGVLAHALDLRETALGSILEEEDPSAFRFKDGTFSWRDLAADADSVAAARRDFMQSFGSCSFDEPREDLRALRMLA